MTPVEGPDLGELARLEAASTEHLYVWERRCRAAESRAQRRCVARARGRADAPEIAALVAEIRQWRNAAPFLLAQAAAAERAASLVSELQRRARYLRSQGATGQAATIEEIWRELIAALDGASDATD